ncbi:MAG: sigma-70 family RNA polymerase sigma factor [Steroidobacteraceae bacterium]
MEHQSDPHSVFGQWNELFQQYRKALAKAVARIVKPHDIEDIVQETYVRLYQASQHQQIRHPKSFMLTTARNIALNHVARADALNHLTSHTQSEDEEEWQIISSAMDGVESPEALVQANEEFLLFCRAVRELPLQCRRAFILKKVYGISQKEVARQLGISEGTVEKHLVKGLVACNAYMKVHGYARGGRAREAANQKVRKAK